VQYVPSGNTEGALSQQVSVAVTSAEGQSPAGHVPALVYETRPFASQEAQMDPQHGTLVPLAMHVPFGHDAPLGGSYPLDWQYPASGAAGVVELDEQAAAARQATTAVSRDRTALMPGPCLIPGRLSRLIPW
jgi:hypothetical protein